MSIRIVRLGTPRQDGEGLRIGTVRRPPRGVRKEEYAARDYFDVWLPELAPSAPLVAFALSQPLTPARWARYARRYRAEMRAPAARRLIELLAALSRRTSLAVGCYCEDEHRCHRSLLAALLAEAGAELARAGDSSGAAASGAGAREPVSRTSGRSGPPRRPSSRGRRR